MNPVDLQDEQELRAQLARARERLEGLVRSLRAVDGELESLSGEQKQHRLLGEACDRLEELSALGAAGLFWGDGAGGRPESQLRLARARVDAFEKRFGEIEERRHAVLEELLQQQEGTELLEGDVLELERQEEERQHEWVVEREVGGVAVLPSLMPWARGGEDDARFRKNLAAALLVSIAFALVVPHVELPAPEPWRPEDAPERLTRLIQEARLVQREPEPEAVKPKPTEETLAEEAPPTPARATSPERAPGPEAPGPKGLLAFREKISGVAALTPDARLGLEARIRSAGDAPSGPPTRSMVTTRAPGSSGGINLASLSRGGGGSGGALAGVQVARATSSIGGGGGGGGAARGSGQSVGGGPAAGRTDEEIQIVFDRYKSALYRLYNRELRNDPTLKGQIVLRIKIEPDGSVSLCVLQATDMNAPQLAAQVVERVRTFDFGAKEGIAAVTILYPIDFLPAT